jgi:predicted LPLAT superfamily acyltransferase
VNAPAREGWLDARERGSTFLLRLTVLLARLLGRTVMRAVVRLIVLPYVVFDERARRASETYWRHLRGTASFGDVYRHFVYFAQCAVDRVFLLRAGTSPFRFRCTGNELLHALAREKRGAVLLGAHLGSFEAMRAMGGDEELPIHIVVHFDNAKRLNAVLAALSPAFLDRVVTIRPGDPTYVLELRELVRRGAMLAILADRTGMNDKVAPVRLLGDAASISTGPFLLASMLRCPVLFTVGLYREPDRYDLFCEMFHDPATGPLGRAPDDLQRAAQRYADRLEHYLRMAPENWFNFFDFWSAPAPGALPAAAAVQEAE